MSRALHTIGDSGFRFAVALLPQWFAAPFAADMRQTFEERQREALTSGGFWLWLGVATKEIGGTMRLAARSRRRGPALLTLPQSELTPTPGAPGNRLNKPEIHFMDTLSHSSARLT